MIHPSEDERVIAGQGTAAVESLEDISNLDLLLCPVGGGGLLGGAALAAKSMRPKLAVIATEPANADDAAQSFRTGRLVRVEKPDTIADGLRTNIGPTTFALIQQYVDDADDAIVKLDRIEGDAQLRAAAIAAVRKAFP